MLHINARNVTYVLNPESHWNVVTVTGHTNHVGAVRSNAEKGIPAVKQQDALERESLSCISGQRGQVKREKNSTSETLTGASGEPC